MPQNNSAEISPRRNPIKRPLRVPIIRDCRDAANSFYAWYWDLITKPQRLSPHAEPVSTVTHALHYISVLVIAPQVDPISNVYSKCWVIHSQRYRRQCIR